MASELFSLFVHGPSFMHVIRFPLHHVGVSNCPPLPPLVCACQCTRGRLPEGLLSLHPHWCLRTPSQLQTLVTQVSVPDLDLGADAGYLSTQVSGPGSDLGFTFAQPAEPGPQVSSVQPDG